MSIQMLIEAQSAQTLTPCQCAGPRPEASPSPTVSSSPAPVPLLETVQLAFLLAETRLWGSHPQSQEHLFLKCSQSISFQFLPRGLDASCPLRSWPCLSDLSPPAVLCKSLT